MISYLNAFTNQFGLGINFVAHTLIFIGTFYVALQNRNLKQWHITPLWYAGLLSLFVAITIIIQWSIGPEHPLSYWNIGLMGETLLNVAFAAIAVIMLVGTVRLDLRNAKKRRNANQIE
jgi:hypothetical protein